MKILFRRVDLYNNEGWVKKLNDTIIERMAGEHGCARYVNDDNQEVLNSIHWHSGVNQI